MRKLEEIAAHMSCEGIYKPPVMDSHTTLWHRELKQEWARAVRDKKKWVLCPKSDTGTHLKQWVAHMLKSVATNEWDELERIPASAQETVEEISAKVLRFVKSALIAGFPAALLWVLDKYGVGAFFPKDYRWMVYFGWPVLIFGNAIEPSLGRLSSLRDTLNKITEYSSK